MRRVVVTGIGLVTPLACGTDLTWNRLIEGKSGLGPIKSFDPSRLSSRIAGEVPREEGGDQCFSLLKKVILAITSRVFCTCSAS